MYCTNCGAKVDDNAKFCSSCGSPILIPDQIPTQQANTNVQTPPPSTGVIEKSTYVPTTTNENQIKENGEPAAKTGKFSGFIKRFTKKKPGKKEKATNQVNEKIEVPEGKSELSAQDPIKSLDQRLEYEDEIHPSYYGYDPTDDRKRKDLRRRDNPDFYPYDQSLEASIGQKMGQNQGFNPNQGERQTFESNLTSQAQGLNDWPKSPRENYDDIPNEYLEARIARQIREQARATNSVSNDSYNDQASHAGNIAGIIRNNQAQNQYIPTQPAYPNHEPYTDRQEVYQQRPVQEPVAPVAPPPPVDTEAEQEVKQKKSFKFNPLYLIPVVVLLLGLVIGYWWMNRTPETVEIDLTEYIEVGFSGDDGEAAPTASIDSSKLLADYGGQIAYTNKDRKDSQYSSPANQFVADLENSTEFNFSKDTNLSNGEELTVIANVTDSSLQDDYNVHITTTIKPVIVDGLITQEYVDPFNYISVDFEGEAPNISLTTSLTDQAPEYMNMVEIAPSKTSELTEGEEVNVSLIYDEDEVFNAYGLRFNPTDKIFVVPGELEPEEGMEESEEDEIQDPELASGYITSIDYLDEELMGTLKYNAGELIRNTFEERSFTEIGNIEYLGAVTGSDANNPDLQNRVMLIYEITANENYEGKYTNNFKYYTFVEYQNVMDEKADDGEFYSSGPMTTDNEIFHKFFVEDDYTYYEIPYYGFGFLEEVISRVTNALSGLSVDNSIAVDATDYVSSTDGPAGEYQGNGTRLTLREDGTLRYKLDQRVHIGTWEESGDSITMTIQGVNVDTPITASFENGSINVSEQGEMAGQTFNKMQLSN